MKRGPALDKRLKRKRAQLLGDTSQGVHRLRELEELTKPPSEEALYIDDPGPTIPKG